MATETIAPSDSSTLSATAQVYETVDDLVVLVRLGEGVLELRVPHAAVDRAPKPRRRIPGFNADATPC